MNIFEAIAAFFRDVFDFSGKPHADSDRALQKIHQSNTIRHAEPHVKQKFEKVIKNMSSFIIKKIPQGQLISLYLGGRILTQDHAPTSDIDLFGIVTDEFSLKTEESLNLYFKTHPEGCGGREGVFHAFYLSDFEGRTKGKSPACPSKIAIRKWVKFFKHYPLIWGKKIDFSKFSWKEITPLEELEIQMNFVKKGITYAKRHHFTWPKQEKFRFQAFVKNILHCAHLEAVLAKGYAYDPSFAKLAAFLESEQDHIVHAAVYLRSLGEKAEGDEYLAQRESFVLEAEHYVLQLKKDFF